LPMIDIIAWIIPWIMINISIIMYIMAWFDYYILSNKNVIIPLMMV
jgi:hypothetical protein